MAELNHHDVEVNQQSAGRTPSDVLAPTSQIQPQSGDEGDTVNVKENGGPSIAQISATEDQVLEDGTTRSDTDTSRADGSNADAKSTDARPVKKAASTKPVSFAKYSVPKVIAANAAKSSTEKAPVSNMAFAQLQPAGRPRLVAKTTSALTQKIKPFRPTAPDPMQVWNKNRVTPQPSTKNLTDEELKQQYGIHLTSRLQSDGEGKEAKWADIDDDEDDWAPETIEWGDGTKTTVNPADSAPAVKSTSTSKPSTPAIESPPSANETKPAAIFATSIGPNATVLKLGARAESQQAQKIAIQPKGPAEKGPVSSSRTTPAPVPAKSPWAKLPPVDKVSPIEISPEMLRQVGAVAYSPSSLQMHPSLAGPTAREISADDFNRSWRDSSQPQLYIPNSGRYESVSENRRRPSRNDQGFRAPAVLQRPSQADSRAPEPSPAFQTNRTSSDVMRRRASSTLSGESGQMARRMSTKSNETPLSATGSAITELPVQQPNVQAPTGATPAYQARGGDYVATAGQTDAELEAQRAQQRKLMREQAELARKRRLEEEERQEAEKKERIRQKLLALGPDPKALKAEQEAKAKANADAKTQTPAGKDQQIAKDQKKDSPTERVSTSPPKPPQPTATGEPQQYGMMKVHPLDSVKKNASQVSQHLPARPPADLPQTLPAPLEEISPEPPALNGIRPESEAGRLLTENNSLPEPISRTNRPVSTASEARASWGRNDHRTPGNLWGAPHNKALGNGTFDQTLAGYAPQDLSSRASSSGQGWMNGKTPTVGQSPQLGQNSQHVPETRSQALQSMTSPEPLPLAMNSEADSMLPVRPPAPIGPPQSQHQQHQMHTQHMVNGYGQNHTNTAVAGWNNFHNVARAQDRAELEQQQRDFAARREDDKRTGGRQQANYSFEETFKQVQLSQPPDQRHVNSVAQSNIPPSKLFGAVGSMPPSAIGPQVNRGSRFFPQQAQVNGVQSPQPRQAMHYPIEVPKSPSPPPAEELSSLHPAYEKTSLHPVVRFPREKAVVKLPPAKPPTPPAPAAPSTATAAAQPGLPSPSATQPPMTWAARVSMPVPNPVTPSRGAQQPIVQNPSWQERFNGLLGNSNKKAPEVNQLTQGSSSGPYHPALAVTSATKEPLDVMPAGSASVSLPRNAITAALDETSLTTKYVEDEEDLFEDREPGSLPHLYFPSDAPAIVWPRPIAHRVLPVPPDPQSAFIFMCPQWKEDKFPKQQFAIVRAPGSEKSVKRDLPTKSSTVSNATHRLQSRHVNTSSIRRTLRAGKPRPVATKAH